MRIPVVYSTANDYEYMMVSIFSLIDNSSQDTDFTIYILVDNSFEKRTESKIRDILSVYGNKVVVEFKSVGSVFDNVESNVDFIKTPTFFRLLIPHLIPESKCIYLDSDTIICGDIQNLYNIDLGENLLAGVKALGYHLRTDKERYSAQARLHDLDQYVNAGVLLMNVELMRKEELVEKFMELVPCGLESQDQDILNSVCYGRILFLPFKYNVMTKYSEWPLQKYEGLMDLSEIVEAWNTPIVVHYADRKKPWKNLDCVMGDYWWNACIKSRVRDYFFEVNKEKFVVEAVMHSKSTNYLFETKQTPKYTNILLNDKIIVYGAGKRGKEVLRWLISNGKMPECIAVSDLNGNPTELLGVRVKEIADLKSQDDAVVIVATMENLHAEIYKSLSGYRFKRIVFLDDSWNERS